jgi:hypothetical protein
MRQNFVILGPSDNTKRIYLVTEGMMRSFWRLFATLIILPVLLISSTPVKAQQAPSGSGLSISPTVSEYTLKPGQADSLEITLKNITVNPIVAQAAVYDFESDNSTGNPKLITDTKQQNPNSIRPFIIGLDNVPLAIGEQKKVTVAVQVPKGTTAGAYYGVIRYKAVPAIPGTKPVPGEVSLSASVGTIVLVTVPGNIKEQVQLTGLHVYSGTKEKPRDSTIFFTKPNQAGVQVRNLGNGFAKPYGAVEIRRTLGGKVVYSYQLNNTTPKANVLPNSSRTFINPIKNINMPGRYSITASVTYGSGSDVLVLTKNFWYLPLWTVIVIVVLLAVLAAAVLFAYRRYRKGSGRMGSHRGY